jgi:cystathionine beta-lyase/cystathionine gamma-synthase
MKDERLRNFLKDVLVSMPLDWLNLTTHRLDIYDESRAKTQFIDQFSELYTSESIHNESLQKLPTAFDYIRLGHPLSCVLEWAIAKQYNVVADRVITFSSQTIPLMAILRKNALEGKATQILYDGEMPADFNQDIIASVYTYQCAFKKLDTEAIIPEFDGTTIVFSNKKELDDIDIRLNVDFFVNYQAGLGSVLLVIGAENESYISEIQHVRRRETIAMTPANTLIVLEGMLGKNSCKPIQNDADKFKVLSEIKEITNTEVLPIVASSGLSIQYAIMMGLIDDAIEQHMDKPIKIIVPPNCYGGTNDQARRVAEILDNVEVVDLPVDSGSDMVQSIDRVLSEIADIDAVPFIIAEIPTNPRVEVPDLIKLKEVLSKPRNTKNASSAIDPVFILDQTFCPNIHFLGEGALLSSVRAISYASGSKFPSGGRCTAGYCVSNTEASALMSKIQLHLSLCDNEATSGQYAILAKQLPSMNQRIQDAYQNTHEFVRFIEKVLPEAKINFVSDALAKEGFTPSVFSLDLPTKGESDVEREAYKRALNHKLIQEMIQKIPNESKYCVSYGQLKGCYWTIPATSTQGTTKEGDKDYIARVALSPSMDLEAHKKVFSDFVNDLD